MSLSRLPKIGNIQLCPDRPLRDTDKNGYVLKFYCLNLGKRFSITAEPVMGVKHEAFSGIVASGSSAGSTSSPAERPSRLTNSRNLAAK